MVVEEEVSTEKVMTELNKNLPEGLRVINAVALKDKARSAMSLVTHARYHITLKLNDDMEFEKSLSDFLKSETIKVFKRQPKKDFQLTELDIKPMIEKIKVISKEARSKIVLDCLLASGSKANLKPELLIEAIKNHMGDIFEVESIERIELYTIEKGTLVPLLSVDNR